MVRQKTFPIHLFLQEESEGVAAGVLAYEISKGLMVYLELSLDHRT